jgi:uncharacterized membrane protein/ketosteroid isomerase-like protein
MENLIIPNWHPLLVHFTVALITMSAVFFVLSKALKSKADTFELVAKWMLWVGAGFTVLTILAGFGAYNSVEHDDVAHVVMKIHRTWALVTGAALLIVALWVYRAKEVSSAIVAASVVLMGLVGATGYLGAELVYRHGLGVMRLPDTSGAGHSHADGGGHDHGDAKSETSSHEHADGEGHGHDTAKPEAPHEHAGSESHDHSGGERDHADDGQGKAARDVDPAAVSEAFYTALRSGDVNAVSMLLADDVLILEGDHAQTSKAEYMAGHMKSDMAFLPNVTSETLSREAGQASDSAWVTTHSRISGTYRDKKVDATNREFLLLRRIGDHWKIVMIQWADK